MAGGKSANLDNLSLQWALSAAAITRPTAWYVAGFTDAVGSNAAPTAEATTANCPGYARQQVTSWTIAGAQAQNAAAATFTATAGWAAINYIGIYDAPTGGNLLYWMPLTTPKTLTSNGDQLQFAPNKITINES